MKTCLKCMTTTSNNNLERCNVCGGTEFRQGRPKAGYKMDPSESIEQQNEIKHETDNKSKTGERIVAETRASNIENSMAVNYDDTVSLGKWLLTFIIMAIPVIGIIYAIVNIVNKNNSNTYKNYMKASLVMTVIAFVLSIVAGSLLTSYIANLMYTLY